MSHCIIAMLLTAALSVRPTPDCDDRADGAARPAAPRRRAGARSAAWAAAGSGAAATAPCPSAAAAAAPGVKALAEAAGGALVLLLLVVLVLELVAAVDTAPGRVVGCSGGRQDSSCVAVW